MDGKSNKQLKITINYSESNINDFEITGDGVPSCIKVSSLVDFHCAKEQNIKELIMQLQLFLNTFLQEKTISYLQEYNLKKMNRKKEKKGRPSTCSFNNNRHLLQMHKNDPFDTIAENFGEAVRGGKAPSIKELYREMLNLYIRQFDFSDSIYGTWEISDIKGLFLEVIKRLKKDSNKTEESPRQTFLNGYKTKTLLKSHVLYYCSAILCTMITTAITGFPKNLDTFCRYTKN